MQLLAIMNAAVEAASKGTHVEALLEVPASYPKPVTRAQRALIGRCL